jgi:ferritin
MLSKEIEEILNKQVTLEGQSSSLYLSIGSWAESKGFHGVGDFFFSHSEEERLHMIKLIKFINERGGRAEVPALEKPQNNFKSVKEIFNLFLETERENTQRVSEIVHHTLNAGDYTTHNFMQWYVSEQMEEEALAQTILEKLEMAGEAPGGGFYLFDRDLPGFKSGFTPDTTEGAV